MEKIKGVFKRPQFQENIILITLALILSVSSVQNALANKLEEEDTLYVVAVSHLDTQWWWTIQKTIGDFLPATFSETFELLDRYPDFVFGWEGAFRYMLLEEYYEDLYQQLLGYIEAERWHPAGSSIEAGDVNVPSPESLMRQFLYGSSFFEREFKSTSIDVFLPDCFGFGYALPSIASHFGLKGFSTQKLSWGSAVDIPFDIGVWEGPDGGSIIAALRPGSYVSGIKVDPGDDPYWMDRIEKQREVSDLRVAYRYFGVGDQGGAPDEESVALLQQAIDADGPIKVISAAPDRLFRDLTPAQVERLPHYKGELLLTTHGTGAYTSQAALKRFNRKNEQLADATERASVMADWLGGLEYQHDRITDAWIRFLAHHFHDDLPGTGIPEIYAFSWNDEVIALNRFASTLTNAVGAAARALDRRVKGVPLIVYNPLSVEREDIVEAVVRFPEYTPEAVRVFGPDGVETPSQIKTIKQGAVELIFLARVPPIGLAAYDVVPSDMPCALKTGLSAGTDNLENHRYRVKINNDGDISGIYDKWRGKELLSGPIRLGLFEDHSYIYPAWEIMWKDLQYGPTGYVGGPAQMDIVESGPARVALRIKRTWEDSSFIQHVLLSAGDAGDMIDFRFEIDWRSSALVKAIFPLGVKNEKATYDLGLGTIERPNNTRRKYEVPAQQWVDLSDEDDSYGVSILNDCKYGWDKPDSRTIRLTFLHTPVTLPVAVRYNQDTQDWGKHRLRFGVFGHQEEWGPETVWRAARLNQPPRVFQTTLGGGELGKSYSLGNVDTAQVAVRALKKAEEGDGYIVRLREVAGRPVSETHFSFGEGIAEAEETNGAEKKIGTATIDDGRIVFDMEPYQTRSFAFVPSTPPLRLDPPQSRPIEISYDQDAVTLNTNRSDGAFDEEKNISIAGELFPGKLTNNGVSYLLGPTGEGEENNLVCRGQGIPIDPGEGERLYVLAGALGDAEGEFTIGEESINLKVQDYTGIIGQWDSRIVDGKVVRDVESFEPAYVKLDNIAWYGTHRHLPEGDEPYVFTYLFQYVLPIPPGTDKVVLPDNKSIRIFAMTLALDPNDRTVAAGELYDGFDPLNYPIDWRLTRIGDGFVEEVDDKDYLGCSGCHTASADLRLFVILLVAGLLLRKKRKL